MQPVHPMIGEMIINGDKPRELYGIRCLLKLWPNPENVQQVAIYEHTWLLFADDEDSARQSFWAHWNNNPKEYFDQPFEIERVVGIAPYAGSVSEMDLIRDEGTAPTGPRAVGVAN